MITLIILLQLDYLPNSYFHSLLSPLIGTTFQMPFLIVIVIVIVIIIVTVLIIIVLLVNYLSFTIIFIVFVFFSYNDPAVIIRVFVYYPQCILNNPFGFFLPEKLCIHFTIRIVSFLFLLPPIFLLRYILLTAHLLFLN